MSPITTNTNYPGSNIGNQGGLWNWLKNAGSSGSQFSISPTITNEQVGNSLQQIQNFGLPTPVVPSPISPMGQDSMLREKKINKIINETPVDEKADFSSVFPKKSKTEETDISKTETETETESKPPGTDINIEIDNEGDKRDWRDKYMEEYLKDPEKFHKMDRENAFKYADRQALLGGINNISGNWQKGLANAALIDAQGLETYGDIISSMKGYTLPTMSMRTPSFKYFS